MLTSNDAAFRKALKADSPGERAAVAVRPGRVSCRGDYCFGAEAAEAAEAADEAASAAELAAAADSLAAEAAASAAGAGAVEEAGGGVVSVVGAGASFLLPQALKTSAAQKAQSASLVFIYRYPGNLMVKRFGDVLSWAYTQLSRAILECFH
jgi:hypothetical protein